MARKRALAEAQAALDEAAHSGRLSEGCYIDVSKRLKVANEGLFDDEVHIKRKQYAEMAACNPSSAKVCTRDVFFLDEEVVRMVLNEGHDMHDPFRERWIEQLMEVYARAIAEWEIRVPDVDGYVRSVMPIIEKFLPLLDWHGEKHFAKKLTALKCCPGCKFSKHVSAKENKLFCIRVVQVCPQLITTFFAHEVECDGTRQWKRLLREAREHATMDNWDDADFIAAVGPRTCRPLRAAAAAGVL